MTFVQNLLFGHQCALCGYGTSVDGALCVGCRNLLPKVSYACAHCGNRMDFSGFTPYSGTCGQCLKTPASYKRVIAAFWYEWPVDAWLLRHKFHADWSKGALLTRELANQIALRQGNNLPDLLVPVPMHSRRVRQRGYNPAADIAGLLSRHLSIPVAYSLAQKTRCTTPQMQLPLHKRIKNVRSSFELTRWIPPSGHVALIDDVMTTGATVGELSRIFQKSRPHLEISIWVLARAVLH